MLQLAGGSAYMDGRSKITQSDIKWVAQTCRYSWHTAGHIPETSPIGTAYGMGVSADLTHGFVMEIECSATPVEKGGEYWCCQGCNKRCQRTLACPQALSAAYLTGVDAARLFHLKTVCRSEPC